MAILIHITLVSVTNYNICWLWNFHHCLLLRSMNLSCYPPNWQCPVIASTEQIHLLPHHWDPSQDQLPTIAWIKISLLSHFDLWNSCIKLEILLLSFHSKPYIRPQLSIITIPQFQLYKLAVFTPKIADSALNSAFWRELDWAGRKTFLHNLASSNCRWPPWFFPKAVVTTAFLFCPLSDYSSGSSTILWSLCQQLFHLLFDRKFKLC